MWEKFEMICIAKLEIEVKRGKKIGYQNQIRRGKKTQSIFMQTFSFCYNKHDTELMCVFFHFIFLYNCNFSLHEHWALFTFWASHNAMCDSRDEWHFTSARHGNVVAKCKINERRESASTEATCSITWNNRTFSWDDICLARGFPQCTWHRLINLSLSRSYVDIVGDVNVMLLFTCVYIIEVYMTEVQLLRHVLIKLRCCRIVFILCVYFLRHKYFILKWSTFCLH